MCNRVLLLFGKLPCKLPCKQNGHFKAVWDLKLVWVHFGSHVNLLIVVSVAQKAKTKKKKKRKTERTPRNKIFSRNVTWWGVAIKFSSKAKASSPTEDMIEWLTDRLCNVIEIKNNETIQSFLVERSWNQWFLSKKSFCTRRSREKKMFSKIWPQNSWEEGSVKQYGCGGLWRL